MRQTEQLNIEGKRSGDGFIAHKATLVSALSRALADRVTLIGMTVGRRGFLAYLKALKGSNLVMFVTQFLQLLLSPWAKLLEQSAAH